MKWIVTVAAGVIGSAAFVVHSPERTASPVVRKLAPTSGGEAPAVESAAPLPAGVAETPVAVSSTRPCVAVEVAGTALPSVAPEEESDDSPALRLERLALLQHELALTPAQRLHVDKVWCEREAEVAAFHAEIRASKVFWVWAHDRRAREILAASHARIAAGLTPEQSRRFFEILDTGRLAEGVSFEITPDITVVR